MSIPSDISGDELARKLTRYGYRITRQKGSHIRLTRNKGGVKLKRGMIIFSFPRTGAWQIFA